MAPPTSSRCVHSAAWFLGRMGILRIEDVRKLPLIGGQVADFAEKSFIGRCLSVISFSLPLAAAVGAARLFGQ